MQNWLTARTAASPNAIALHYAGQSWTYAELSADVALWAAYLHEHGVQAGDRVGILLDNRPLTVNVIHALLRLGAVLVPINTRLTAAEINYQTTQTAAVALICAPDDPRQADLTARIIPAIDPVHTATPAPPAPPVDLNAPACIVHTSGTSGQPKGAILTYGNLFYSAMASAYRIGLDVNDRWLCVLPLYHVGGLSIVVRSCLYGTAIDLHARFDVDAIQSALTETPVTLVSLVPTMLYRLLKHDAASWNDAFRLILLGGAAATPELMADCVRRGLPVAATYGLSEAASQVATTLPGTAVTKAGTVGKPLLFTQVRVVDEAGDAVPDGQIGEVIVSGPTVMQGYINNPDATAATLRDGWLFTGDMGYLDADGDLWLVQRRSDLIVTGGENVYPSEVEAVLRQHPAVAEVAVVGLSSAEWGQVVAAAVVCADGVTVTPEELTAYCRQHLAGYKIPRRYQFVDDLPQTASGKIERAAVRALFDGTNT